MVPFMLLPVMASAQSDSLAERSFLPQIGGWSGPVKFARYDADNLWNIIDGAAYAYLNYDFVQLTTARYETHDDKYITVDIYRQKTPDDAFGIYSQERPQDAQYKAVGAQGYQVEYAFNYVSDRYYVKIRSNFPDEGTARAMSEIAAKSAELISTDPGLPRELRFFPDSGKMANAEQFINKNFLSYSFFSRVFTCNYQLSGSVFTLFIMKGANPGACRDAIEAFFKQAGMTTKAGEGIQFHCKDPYNGPVLLEWKGNYLLGAYSAAGAVPPEHYLDILSRTVVSGQ